MRLSLVGCVAVLACLLVAAVWARAQNVKELPDYDKIQFPKYKPVPLEDVLPNASPGALRLLSKLLVYNPAKRIKPADVSCLNRSAVVLFVILRVVVPHFAMPNPEAEIGSVTHESLWVLLGALAWLFDD